MANKSYQVLNLLPRGTGWGKLIAKISFLGTKISLFIQRFLYNLLWWPGRLIFSFFLHFEVEAQINLKRLKGPLIIASNHSAWLDPILIGAAFPFRSEVFPIRFACWYRYYYNPFFAPFLWIIGTFPIRKGIGLERVLKIPVKILKNKGVVGIFPEGRRTKRRGRQPRGRRGTAYIAIKTRTKILPVKIEGSKNMKPDKFFQRCYKVKIKIGKTFYLPSQKIIRPKDLNKPTNLILEKIREL